MKSKILFVLHVPPPVHGAAMAGTYIRDSSLIKNEFDTHFINLSTSTHLRESGKGSLRKLFVFLSLQYKVIQTLLRERYDLCYITLNSGGAGFYKDLMVVAVCKLFGKKIIYHLHNKGVASAKDTKLNSMLFTYAFRNTSSIMMSRFLYPDISRFVNQSNVYFCPYGVPANKTLPSLNFVAAPEQATCRFLFLANMMEEKGVYILAEACKTLSERGLNFECNFVGGWSDVTKEAFESRIVELGLDSRLFSHGPKYGEDKHKFFADSDIFVFPTFYHYEAFPFVILEAMQHGLPVVSCPEGGIPDIIIEGKTGYLVPQKDVNALADKLEVLILNPELRKAMGQEAKIRFEQYFRLETFESNIRDILKTAIAQNPS